MTPSTNIQLFHFDNVATGETMELSAFEKGGEAWFIASDVCKALGLHPTAPRRLDDDEKGMHITQTLGGPQQVTIINESGLYALIFSSRKEEAKRFRKWISATVIPSIRRHGGYINGMEELSQQGQAETLQAVQREALRVLSRHEEEREARSDALRLMRRRTPSRYLSKP